MTRRSMYKFRLYVADDTMNSAQAAVNLRVLCQTYLPNHYEIEIVDVFKEPQRAILEGIRMTPTLLRLAPLPIRRIVGTLVDTQRVLEALGLDVPHESEVAAGGNGEESGRSIEI
jgi:circadian clock protein KaiB